MVKASRENEKKIPRSKKILRSTFLWQFLLAAVMLAMAALFIRSEHVELRQIREQFLGIYPIYLLLGGLLTALYIFLQGEMYVQSFKTVQWKLKRRHAILLFLKRNLVSVFLPAGGFSSLTFWHSDRCHCCRSCPRLRPDKRPTAGNGSLGICLPDRPYYLFSVAFGFCSPAGMGVSGY